MDSTKRSVDCIEQLNYTNKKICKLFEENGLFLSENIGFPDYHRVRGDNYREIPDNTLLEHHKTWPVYNEPWKNLEAAVHACERLGGILLSSRKEERATVLARDFMLEGSTLPIRVTYRITAQRQEHRIASLFVKQMNLNRIFLSTLYKLANNEQPRIIISESSIVEREVHGPSLIAEYNKNHAILSDSRFKRELIRLNVIAKFISLFDMDNGVNVVIDRHKQWQVIDFDKGFWEPIPDPREQIINPFMYKAKKNGKTIEEEYIELPQEKLRDHFKGRELDTLVREEMLRVETNIKRNAGIFYKCIDAMADIEYYNKAVQELYGENNVATYFIKALVRLRKEGNR